MAAAEPQDGTKVALIRIGPLATAMVLAIVALAFAVIYLGRYPGVDEHAYPVFMQQILYDDRAHALAMFVAFGVALAAVANTAVADIVGRVADAIGRFPGRTCAIVLAVLVIAARWIYQGFPYSMDEYAPLLQARAFAEGRLAVQYPPALLDLLVYPAYQGHFIMVNHETGQAMSVYWPGLALLMAPFSFLRLELALNPVLSTLALWLIGDLAARAGNDERYRGWAMLAAIVSPQFTINAVSFYAMPGLLALNLLYLWLLMREGVRSAFLAGVVGGLALVMINPVPHALFAVPCLLWMLLDQARRKRLIWIGLGYFPLAFSLGIGWLLLTSDMGMVRSSGASPEVVASAGFIQEWLVRLQGIFTLPDQSIVMARWYASWKTWIWMAPGMMVLPWLCRARSQLFWLMAWALLLCFAFYFFVPYDQGYGWGYRYIHPAWGFFPIFTAIAIAHSGSPFRTLGAAGLLAGMLATPVFAWVAHERIDGALGRRIEAPVEGNSVVFIKLPMSPPNIELVQNYPNVKNSMYLISQGDDLDAQLMGKLWPQASRVQADDRGSLWLVPPAAGDSSDRFQEW